MRKIVKPNLPVPFPGEPVSGYEMRTAIDWEKYRAVVFESDDWGTCEATRNSEDAAALSKFLDQWGNGNPWPYCTLETPDDLERLYQVLESARGCDGQTAVFTAFMLMGNPDFAAIAASDFQEYHDIGLDEGVPPGWERGDLIGKWREGVNRGVFSPEFHGNLHHINPTLWLELLRGDSPESETARTLFQYNVFSQGRSLPEYHGMNAKEQHAWVSRGVARFERLFGFAPQAGVSSDALPMTEIIWSVNGLKIFCLKNVRSNGGPLPPDDTPRWLPGDPPSSGKLWNSMDQNCPMGAYNRRNDLVYLGRNLYLDGRTPQDAEKLQEAVSSCWQLNEPVIVNTHRTHYASVHFHPEVPENGLRVLSDLLAWITQQDRVRFLTTGEVGQLYRDGYSVRRIGNKKLIRQWADPTMTVKISAPIERIVALPSGDEQTFFRDGNDVIADLKEGDYLAI